MKKDAVKRNNLYYYDSKPTINMRKAKLFPAFIMGAFFFSFAIAGCNGSDTKETKKDSTVIKTDTMVPKKDTTKMDTTAVNKMTDKPIVNP